MLRLAILGFLYDTPLHGYELRKRIAALSGQTRPVAESTLYPAVKRLERAGLLVRETRPGTAAPRHVLTLTTAGREELVRRLAEPEEADITDGSRWFTLLAFLRHLDDPRAQAAVLGRRLEHLRQPPYLFSEGGRPLRAEEVDDPFRRGVLTIARASGQAELAWLRRTLDMLSAPGRRNAAESGGTFNHPPTGQT